MAQNITLVALSQMVDLSLNCHEGVINFHTLHTLLHVMIQQLSLTDVAIEFRGVDSDRIQALISSMKPTPTNLLPEYSIVGEQKSHKKKSTTSKKSSLQDVIKEQQKIEEKKEKEIRVIERRKDSKEDPEQNPLPLKSPPGASCRCLLYVVLYLCLGSFLGITPADLQTVVVVESQSNLPQYSIAVSKVTFDDLQNDVDTLKGQIKELTELPGNMGLIEATRKQSGPILDMFHILNLTKRMDANETAVEKMGSLIEDLAQQEASGELVQKIREVRGSIDASDSGRRRSSVNQLEVRINTLENIVTEMREDLVGGRFIHEAPAADTASEVGSVTRERGSVATQEETGSVASRTPKDKETITLWEPQGVYTSVLQEVDFNELPPNQALVLVQQEFDNLKHWVTESIKEVDKAKVLGHAPTAEVNTEAIDRKFKECTKKMEELNSLYNTQIGLLNEQFNNVQQEMNDVVTKLEVILPGGDSTGINAETTMDLANKLVLLEKELITMSETAAKLQEEKEERDKQLEAIMEQIDILKIVKANREDLEDALGDKADACMINRKVSHDQFDAACDDLSRGIEEALTKLEEQEEMWHQALESIQKEVGNKLDKMEVDPLRDFVNSKLRALQEKFKSLTALKREQEAAGTKSKFLRNVNCISCDKDVVMRKEMDVSLKPKAYAMPPSRNMAPYLAYELDQLRKQQRCVPNSKNLNFFESALKTRGTKDKDHVCNRYCGGSHTITTPQQRVTRLGHFLEQWGPEIAPLNEEYIRGNDNHMYRARDESVYQKTSKGENQMGGSVRASGDAAVTRDGEEPQKERDTFISPDAEEAIAGEERSDHPDKKVHNIGSTSVDVTEELMAPPEVRASYSGDQRGSRSSQMQAEPRASQVRGSQAIPRASQVPQGEARASQAVPRASQIPGDEPRPSQAAPRPSQMPSDEPRASQAAPRPSQAPSGAPRPSQAPSAGPRSSQSSAVPKGSQIPPRLSLASGHGTGSPRASQAVTSPRGSQIPMHEPRPSQTPSGAPRASQAATGEPRASHAPSVQRQGSLNGNGARRQSQTSDRRASQTHALEGKSSPTQNVKYAEGS
ncbi:unnamed protein product [Tenebrio molitor]|nr:unnamed protein product [Tenebrio molitor]